MTEVSTPGGNATRIRESIAAAAVYAIPLALAAYTRALAFSAAAARPLEGDAAAFYRLASKPVSLFTASEREPFFMLLHRLAFLGMNGGPSAIRMQSLIFAIILVGLVTWVSRRIMARDFTSLVPGLALALTPYMAYSATRGLRLELFLCLGIGLCATLFPEDKKLSWPRAVGAGFLAAALCLTRQAGIAVAAPLFAAAIAREPAARRLDYGRWLTAAALALLIISPFFISQRIKYGSAFHIGDRDAVFWRNQEFRDRPGFPTSAQIAADPYLGPMVTPGQYVFGMHSAREAAARVVKGYYLCFAFFYPHALLFAWPLLLLALPGAAALIARRQWQWLLLLFLVLLPFAFIIPVPVIGHVGADARFAMHGFPLVCLLMGAGLDYIIELAGRLKKPEAREA